MEKAHVCITSRKDENYLLLDILILLVQSYYET